MKLKASILLLMVYWACEMFRPIDKSLIYVDSKRLGAVRPVWIFINVIYFFLCILLHEQKILSLS